MRSISTAAALLAAVSSVSATFNVHNWCTGPVYIWQSNNGDCDKGPNSICYNQPGAAPWTVAPGDTIGLDWMANNQGTSIKMSKTATDNSGILQFEYTMGNGDLYWDLSDLDGNGAALNGSPFYGDNVKINPAGPGSGTGDCQMFKCPANQICADAYNDPNALKTHYCPEAVGTFWLDLCEPAGSFKKRGATFSG